MSTRFELKSAGFHKSTDFTRFYKIQHNFTWFHEIQGNLIKNIRIWLNPDISMDFFKNIKSKKLLLKATGFHVIHRISHDFMKSTLFYRISLNSTDFTNISRISLCGSLLVFFAEFIIKFITNFTEWNPSEIYNEILLILVKFWYM